MIYLALGFLLTVMFHWAIRLGVEYEQMDASFPLLVVALALGMITTVFLFVIRSLL